MVASEKLNAEINKLINLTKSGKIKWSNVVNNTNSYFWDKSIDKESYRTSVFATNPHHPIAASYSFSIVRFTPAPQTVLLQVHTNTDPIYKDIIAHLFDEAQNSAKDDSANILSNLLKDIS